MPRSAAAFVAALLCLSCDGATTAPIHYEVSDPDARLERELAKIRAEGEADRARIDAEIAALEAERAYLKTERALGTIKAGENMGARYLVLDEMIVPVIGQAGVKLVYTLELRFARVPEDSRVSLMISPKYTHDGGWQYLECHETGLRIDGDWSKGGKRGSDGNWLTFDAEHDGRVLDGGRTIETVVVVVEATLLAEFAADEGAGGQICLDKFDLSPEQRAQLAEFLATPL